MKKNSDEFFPEDYILDFMDEDTYYCSEERAIEMLSDHFGIDFKDISEASILVNESQEKEEGCIYMHKIQLV